MTVKNTALQPHLRKVLHENFNVIRSNHKNFSLRSYAKKIGVSVTALSEMMNGKRIISQKTAHKILLNLDLSDKEREKISRLEQGKKALESEAKSYFRLDIDRYHAISDWYYFGILSLAETDDFIGTSEWISKRLNITDDEATNALKNLEELNIMKKDEAGVLRPTGTSFKLAPDLETFKKGHTDNLDLAKEGLNTAEHLCDYSSMTMSIDTELIPEAKELILNFRRKLAQFLESGKKEEVYKLNIQLFPITKRF